MTAIPAAPDSIPAPPTGPSRATRIVIAVGLWIILFLSLLKLPAGVSSGLDPSWRMVIGHAVGRDFQWGKDLVFTYGPLGYLLASTNHGEHYHHFLIWQALSNAVFATVILIFGCRFSGWRAFAYYAYFLAFVANYLDAMHMTMVVLLVMTALRQAPGARPWLLVVVGALLAVLSLVKFTNLMLAGFGMLCFAAHHAWRRRWADLGIGFGSYAGAFLVGWVLCDQNLANLPAYVFTSLEASGGYSEGMAFYETTEVFLLGLGSALAIGGYYLLSLWRRADLPLALATMLVACAASFMNWKHGFSRADGHVFAHFISCLLVVVTFPVLLADDGPLRRLKVGVLSLAAALALYGTFISATNAITDAAAIWNYNLKTIVNALRILPDLKRNADQQFRVVSGPHYLHATRQEIGDAPVDMLGNEQAYILFNRFNYRPRPVFQSYLPYTEKLLRLNGDFYRSSEAPEFVIYKMDTIDMRFPLQEDSLALRQLLYGYRYILEERTMLLWRRVADSPPPEPREISRTRVRFGESIAIPASADEAVWAEIKIKPSLLGRLRNFLYKAPIITMAITDAGGFTQEYRAIRRMANEGFLIYPYFTSAYNIQRYMAGDPPPRADRFTFNVPESHRKYFQRDFEVVFSRLPPVPRYAGTKRITTEDATFRMFDKVPETVNSLYPTSALHIDGHDVLLPHPPSTLEFKVDFPATRVTGSFGISSGAHTPPNNTDGCEFIVEWVAAGGKTTRLFYRHLQPSTVEADRGLQDFDVALPPGGGRLLLRITPGPAGDIVCDWAYWTDLRFSPRPPAQP